MTLEEAKQRIEHIRATAEELNDDEAASGLERSLYIDALEACVAHTIDIPTLKEILNKVQVIQFRRWGP
jgi:DNA-binding TFAR19-related protein (PDSD5 family)